MCYKTRFLIFCIGLINTYCRIIHHKIFIVTPLYFPSIKVRDVSRVTINYHVYWCIGVHNLFHFKILYTASDIHYSTEILEHWI